MKKAKHGQRIDAVFVLLIFSIFVISVLIVLVFGASIYQNVSEYMETDAYDRLVLSYISTRIKTSNDAGMIYIAEFYGENALMIDEVFGDREFQTIIYYHDGWLYELFSEKGLGLSRCSGTQLIRANSLEFETLGHGLIRVTAGNYSLLSNLLEFSVMESN